MNSITHHPETIANSNGLKLNYDSFGDKQNPVVLLIMGLGTQMIYWEQDFCRMLARQGFRVIRFDNRDVGKSTWIDNVAQPSFWKFVANSLFKRPLNAAYRLHDMAADSLGLLDALNINKAHIVGASMGGMIAQLLAIQSPSRVLSLTSIMSTTGNRALPKASLGFSMKVFSPPPKDKTKLVSYTVNVWRLIHGDVYGFELNKIESLIKLSIERGANPAGNARQLAAILDSADRTQDLEKLDVPTLVIHGENDPLIPAACGVATAKAIPNAKLKLYPGMGHTFPTELYQDIIDTIGGHIKGVI